MPGATVRDFPLFPLEMVALPSEVIPLHIFEERYKTMISVCLERGSEFGIVWLSGEGLRDVGCAVEVAEVLERLEDGRMNLVTRGTRVFRLLKRQDELPYPAGEVEFVADREESPDPDATEVARKAYADLVERATDRRPTAAELRELDAYGMAATVDFGLHAKQGLLDMRSENGRLRMVARLFGAALRRMERATLTAARARSNGKVRFA